jgi:SAM-dependent methyltransferase
MDHPHNPQASQMSDASMIRTLSAQAAAIWPQEAPLLDRYGSPSSIVDVGCGTGEITARLLDHFPTATALGLDLDAAHLERARARCPARATFQIADALDTGLPPGAFDLVVCRHVLLAVPRAYDVCAELVRITRPGGWVHVLSEDYTMIHFPLADGPDPDHLFHHGALRFGAAGGTDMRVGRHTWAHLRRLGLVDLRVDYVTVDTLRVNRPIFADIWRSWRDGYTAALASALDEPPDRTKARWDQMIDAILDPDAYCVWQVPIISGRRPVA